MDKEYSFNGQRDGEKVLEVIASHPYLLYSPALKTVLIFVLGLAVILFLPAWYIAAIFLVLFGGVYLFRAIYNFKESILIITDQRLFVVEQKGFFKRRISETDLNKILGISSQTDGFAKTILKYGDLIVRTAGAREESDMIVKNIPDPYSVQQRIANLDGVKAENKARGY